MQHGIYWLSSYQKVRARGRVMPGLTFSMLPPPISRLMESGRKMGAADEGIPLPTDSKPRAVYLPLLPMHDFCQGSATTFFRRTEPAVGGSQVAEGDHD